MIRPACSDDAARIEEFLSRHPDSSMFLRSGLAEHGPCGGAASFAARFWLEEGGGAVRGVFALTSGGVGLMQAPGAFAWAGLRGVLRGEVLSAMNGVPEQVALARQGLGLAGRTTTLDRVEPLYTLALDELVVPEGAATLRGIASADLAVITPWRGAYLREVMGARAGPATEALAQQQARRMVGAEHTRILETGGQLVAMSAFNAVVADRVQIGSVFTPPALRGLGFARRIVALHLAQARAAGKRAAVLFAASPAAARAYEAIGFRLAGRYHLVDFGRQIKLGGAP